MSKSVRPGSAALLLVLWLVVVLVGASAATARLARDGARRTAVVRAEVIARYAAESGVELARVELERRINSAGTLAARAQASVQLARELEQIERVPLTSGQFAAGVIDLGARIDINRADSLLLWRFLLQFAMHEDVARIASAVMTRRADREFERVEEALYLPGVNRDVVRKALPYLCVGGDARINVNTAPLQVLRALPGVDTESAQRIISQRGRSALGSSSATMDVWGADRTTLPPQALPYATTLPARFLIVSRGWANAHPLTHEIQAVYTVVPRMTRLEHWQERSL